MIKKLRVESRTVEIQDDNGEQASNSNRTYSDAADFNKSPNVNEDKLEKQSSSADDQLLQQVSESPAISIVAHQVLKAYEIADRCGRDRWDFSVELQQLLNAGAQIHVVRMMVNNGWIACQQDLSNGQSTADASSELEFKPTSGFVVTDKGLPVLTLATKKFPDSGSDVLYGRPVWDEDTREFKIGNRLIKQFRWKAINQEKVLEAFAGQNWPTRIDDPLPLKPGICPKQRLHDTIKCLNRKHVNKGLVKFRGDGTGSGVLLEILTTKPE